MPKGINSFAVTPISSLSSRFAASRGSVSKASSLPAGISAITAARVAELALYYYAAIIRERHHGHRAAVFKIIPPGGLFVAKLNGITVHVEYRAGILYGGGNRPFKKPAVVHVTTLLQFSAKSIIAYHGGAIKQITAHFLTFGQNRTIIVPEEANACKNSQIYSLSPRKWRC